jgi:hypothetical protein
LPLTASAQDTKPSLNSTKKNTILVKYHKAHRLPLYLNLQTLARAAYFNRCKTYLRLYHCRFTKTPGKKGEKGTIKITYNAAAVSAFNKTIVVTSNAKTPKNI